MKFGLRKPSLKKSFKARTTGKWKRRLKRSINPFYGKRGIGFIKNPVKSVKNRIYHRTTFSWNNTNAWIHIFLIFTTAGIGNIVYLLCQKNTKRNRTESQRSETAINDNKYCSNCSSQLNGANFCPQCGTVISAATEIKTNQNSTPIASNHDMNVPQKNKSIGKAIKKGLVISAIVFVLFFGIIVALALLLPENEQPDLESAQSASGNKNNDTSSNINGDTSTEEHIGNLTGKALIEGFILKYNQTSPNDITDTSEINITDRESGHYRTEFRLNAFQGAYSKTGKIGNIVLDIVTYGYGENDDIRIYVDDISLDKAKEIIKYAVPILDDTVTNADVQEVLDYLDEYKYANGYYCGDIGILFTGGNLMIKSE